MACLFRFWKWEVGLAGALREETEDSKVFDLASPAAAFFETRSHCLAQAGPKIPGASNPSIFLPQPWE
jgi:hypothetical protein